MKKLICDLCGEEAGHLYNITAIDSVKRVDNGHTYREEKIEVCANCESKYKYESHKALERVYKKLKKVK